MDGWLAAAATILVVLACCALLLGLLAARRRWLARDGGTFECSLRLRTRTEGTGWVLGVARYNEEQLEWFRFFSYSVRPRRSFRRGEVRILDTREPEPGEAAALYAGQQVVRLEERTPGPARYSDLAMGPESVTGLLSWLEAAPPGQPAL